MIWIDCGCFGGDGVEAEVERGVPADGYEAVPHSTGQTLGDARGMVVDWDVEDMMMRWY